MNRNRIIAGVGVAAAIGVILVLIQALPSADPRRIPPAQSQTPPQDYIDAKDDTARSGDVVTAQGLSTRYYVAPTMKRYVFTDEQTFATWYPNNFNVKTIDRKKLESLPLAGNVTQRPGMRVIKFATDPKYYVVAHAGVLRPIRQRLLSSYYGKDWPKRVDTIEEYYRADYTIGADIKRYSDYSPMEQYQSSPTISIDKGVAPTIRVERSR